VTSKNFDFEARLHQVREEEEARRKEKKDTKKRKREETKAAGVEGKRIRADDEPPATKGAFGNKIKEEAEAKKVQAEQDAFASMMGFGGFGGGVKRR
jgi:hypothetical protein